MAQFDDRAAELFEHQGGDFAGERACVFVVAILRADEDRGILAVFCHFILVGKDLLCSRESGKRRDNEKGDW